MKWHSLLKDPSDLPQRINEYEESEDVMIVERRLNDCNTGFEYVVLENLYYGHWKPNGNEGWRVRGKNYSDCGRFGGFDTDSSYNEYQESTALDSDIVENFCSEEEKKFIKENCYYDENIDSYITRTIVGWSYYPNAEEFVEENKDLV